MSRKAEHLIYDPGEFLCDFCGSPSPRWSYRARTYDVYEMSEGQKSITGRSVGDWAACDECHKMIEQNDRNALATRAARVFAQKHPEIVRSIGRSRLVDDFADVHDGFFRNRLDN